MPNIKNTLTTTPKRKRNFENLFGKINSPETFAETDRTWDCKLLLAQITSTTTVKFLV